MTELRTERTAFHRYALGCGPQSVACARIGRARERWLLLVARRRGRLFRACASLRGLSAELCSLRHRIGILQQCKLAHFGLDLGPLWEKGGDGRLVPCRRTHACTQDIIDLQARYSWSSLTDLYLCQIAWVAGFETCASQNRDSGNQSRTDQALP